MGIFNAVKKVLHLASAMECADGDKYRVYWNALTVINKIVFTSPEATVQFSEKKNKTSALVKTF